MFLSHRMTKVMVGESCTPHMQARVMSMLALGDAMGNIVGKSIKQTDRNKLWCDRSGSLQIVAQARIPVYFNDHGAGLAVHC